MSAPRIGPYTLPNRLILAPMAGVTDRPFRQLCRRLGAGLVVSEMVTSDVRLWNSRKSSLRLLHAGDPEPRSVQIAGGDPQMMADAARKNVELGAQIIDINMGCPAKKVCNKAAGSALLRDEPLVREILDAVVGAVDVPVTLKIRTGCTGRTKTALPWRKSPKMPALLHCPYTVAPAPTFIPAKPSTTPSPPSSRRYQFRCSPMATSTLHRRPRPCSTPLAPTPCSLAAPPRAAVDLP